MLCLFRGTGSHSLNTPPNKCSFLLTPGIDLRTNRLQFSPMNDKKLSNYLQQKLFLNTNKINGKFFRAFALHENLALTTFDPHQRCNKVALLSLFDRRIKGVGAHLTPIKDTRPLTQSKGRQRYL